MTAPGADRTPRSAAAKGGFLIAVGVTWAVLLVADDALWTHHFAVVAARGPGALAATDVLPFAIAAIMVGLMYYSASLYRRRYAGTRWIAETFIGMTAAFMIGCLVSGATIRTYTDTWSRLRDGSLALINIGFVVVVSLLMGAVSVGAEVWRVRRIAKQAGARPPAMPG
jgi:hypothetical protein